MRSGRWYTFVALLLLAGCATGHGKHWGTGSTEFAGNPCPSQLPRLKRLKLAKLQGHDHLAHPGEIVTLRAKLERQGVLGINPDLSNQTLVFCSDGIEIARAKTDDDGFAEISMKAEREGAASIRVSLQGSSKYWAVDDNLLLSVLPKDAPILICDIDHTISDVAEWQVPFKKIKDSPPLPEAPRVLGLLGNKYRIVYLSARPDALVRHTRNWLRHWKFPAGPLVVGDHVGDIPLNQGEFKTNIIGDMRRHWSNVRIGIGDKPHDGEAYVKNEMDAYIIGREADELPEGATPVRGWLHIERLLLND